MINFTLIYVGNIKDKFFADAVAEYEKRIKGFCKLKNIEIKLQPSIIAASSRDVGIVLMKLLAR